MLEISNLRIEKNEEIQKLVADIKVEGIKNPFTESQIWFQTDEGNGMKFSCDSYDAFVLVPTYLAMYYKTDLHIKGNVSRKFYRNLVHYIIPLFCNFSDNLERINVIVDGFTDSDTTSGGGTRLVGTGISCGIDSLSTIFDNYVKEEHPEYRINSLFLFNCGTHGDFNDSKANTIFDSRVRMNKTAANELGLKMYIVNSNLHSFTHLIGEQKMGYIAIYSCILSLQNQIKRYYVSSSYSYQEMLQFHEQAHDFDMAEYCESVLIPLIHTEKLELILDGSQYKRSKKTENIADWEFAQKHLNVCVNPDATAKNCSCCSKCFRTLMPLDVMGKLEKFDSVFDLDTYKKNKIKKLDVVVWNYGKNGFDTDNYDFALKKGYPLPSKGSVFFRKVLRKLRIKK